MAKSLYDPRCEDLARLFLSDPPPGEPPCAPDEAAVSELAGVIQRAIEDWNWSRVTPKDAATVRDLRRRNNATDPTKH